MSAYTVTEPHPTIPQNAYAHSGRGGAGNTFRVAETTPASGVPTAARPTQTLNARFYSGRGGAGNAHAATERHALSFEEEYSSAAHREKVHSGHVGRGGAGNVYGEVKKDRKHSDASSRRDSNSTNGSVRSGFWGRLSMGSHH